MRKSLTILCFIFSCLSITAQEGHKLDINIDASFNMNYMFKNEDGIKDPAALGMSLGYEYDVNMFFGIEGGFRFGGFNQSVRYYDPNLGTDVMNNPNSYSKNVYKGMYWAPYIAPKIYLPISYDDKKDRARYIFVENRFSYTQVNLDLDEVSNMKGSTHKFQFQYEIRAGYQFPIDTRWAMSCWLGYNTFDFSKVKPEAIEYRNSTPIQIGIGFNYIIKQ
ncbi:outer membrane beta-barrel protein [Dysgonomonas sp. Marseille-P4677]|uniref:outer membrane beta-barrel protein n=1 Tax=Dysgonomonas sp. Marseille-P4677 TaxID=2364790 RepID=UPI001914BAB4|nr:outer membrane beta-barrel protein [Dysgonomonas sp. Marseille-P4677]MBK5720552.1 outer membrane beta-barrel protein [Dysgonomonas sp. Marseille-P4677]